MAKAVNAKELGSMKDGVNLHESAIGLGVLSWSLVSSRSSKFLKNGLTVSISSSSCSIGSYVGTIFARW